MNRFNKIANRVAAFEPGFPEMTEDDWKALGEEHKRKVQQWEREKAEYRKQVQQEWEEEDRMWLERERKLRQRTKREMGLASGILKVAKSIVSHRFLVNDLIEGLAEGKMDEREVKIILERDESLAFGVMQFSPWGKWLRKDYLDAYRDVLQPIASPISDKYSRKLRGEPRGEEVEERTQLWEPCERCGREPSYQTAHGHLCEKCMNRHG